MSVGKKLKNKNGFTLNDDYCYDVTLICRQEGVGVHKQEVDITFSYRNYPDTKVPKNYKNIIPYFRDTSN